MIDKKHILVVDDNEVLKMTLSRLLNVEGYTVLTASGGDEAIKIVQNEYVDLVLLDINMPNVNGYDVLIFIKQNYPSIKVVMVTAYADLKNAVESKKLGADEFITKPFNVRELFSTIFRLTTVINDKEPKISYSATS
jgi:CheY-like chemotaxis protein